MQIPKWKWMRNKKHFCCWCRLRTRELSIVLTCITHRYRTFPVMHRKNIASLSQTLAAHCILNWPNYEKVLWRLIQETSFLTTSLIGLIKYWTLLSYRVERINIISFSKFHFGFDFGNINSPRMRLKKLVYKAACLLTITWYITSIHNYRYIYIMQ